MKMTIPYNITIGYDELSVPLQNAFTDLVRAGGITQILGYGVQRYTDVLCKLFSLFASDVVGNCHFHGMYLLVLVHIRSKRAIYQVQCLRFQEQRCRKTSTLFVIIRQLIFNCEGAHIYRKQYCMRSPVNSCF